MITEPTHKNGKRLDLVFVDVPTIVNTKVCEFIGSSDHYVIEMFIYVSQHIPMQPLKKRSG